VGAGIPGGCQDRGDLAGGFLVAMVDCFQRSQTRWPIMITRRGLAAAAASVLTGSLVLMPGPAQADDTEFKIQVYCNDVSGAFPLAGVRVELWRRGLDELPKVITDTLVRVSHAATDGRVAVRVKGDEDDYYFRIVLADNDGVRAEHHAYPWAWFADTDTNQNDVPVHDYGTIGLGDGSDHPPCTAFEGVRRAYQDFIATTGSRPPYDVSVQLNAPGRAVPGATMDEIHWPPGWPASKKTTAYAFMAAQHEFAHAFRDGLDGDADHRADDAQRFGYGRKHSGCDRFNEGFAFQEGWAEFWARQEAGRCPGAAVTDFAYEDHVNLGLASIERWCMSRAQMADVLRRNPGRIHSFAEFAKAGDCQGRLISEFEPGAGEIEAVPSKVILNSLAKQRQVGLVRERQRYTTQWKKAVKQADRLGGCRSCEQELITALKPWSQRLQLQQVDLLIDAYGFERTSKGRKALGPPGSPEFERALRQIERKYRKRAIAIGKAAVKELAVDARPYLRRSGADGTLVAERLRQLQRELSRGRIPVGLLPAAPGSDQVVAIQGPVTPPDGGTCVIERGGQQICT
jgi:hypothetical protein